MNGLGRRSLALKLRKETTLSHVKIAEKVNASPQTVSRWLKGIPAGSDVRQTTPHLTSPHEVVKTRLSTRFKTPHLTSPHLASPHLTVSTGKVKKRGVSDEVKKTLDEATEIVTPTIKKVKAKKSKPVYIPATIERIDSEPIPDPEETQETLDLEPKEKKSSGFMIWVFLAVILFIAGYYLIKWWSERSDQISGIEEQKPVTPTNPNGLGGEIDFTQGGI